MNEEVSVELVRTRAELREAYELRWQVYCVERGFLVGQNGVEFDEYDDFSRHAVVRWKQTGEVVGTVRLVLPKSPPGGDDFPLQHVCDPAVLRDIPRATTGELSRFSLAKQLTKQVRSMSAETSGLLRLALLRAAVWLSAEAGNTHLLAVMEPTLLRLLRASGIHMAPLGPLVEYHGLRQPVVADLVPVLARVADERPPVWDFITRCGPWYSESPAKPQPVLEELPA